LEMEPAATLAGIDMIAGRAISIWCMQGEQERSKRWYAGFHWAWSELTRLWAEGMQTCSDLQDR